MTSVAGDGGKGSGPGDELRDRIRRELSGHREPRASVRSKIRSHGELWTEKLNGSDVKF